MTENGFFKPGDVDLIDPDQACHTPRHGFAAIGIKQFGIAKTAVWAARHVSDTKPVQQRFGDAAQVAQPVTRAVRAETVRRCAIGFDERRMDFVTDLEAGR